MCIKVPDELREENIAVRLLEAYFADDPVTGRARYSGAYFERLGGGGDRPDTAYQLTAEDLLAVSMLSVPVDRYYALHVLYYRGREISDLLSRIPLGVCLQDPEAGALIAQGGPAWALWQLLCDIRPRPGDDRLGPVAAGKLLARKRPQLIPIYDSHVRSVLNRDHIRGTWWRDLRCQLLNDQDLVCELESVRARAGVGHLSLLRTFDIMCRVFAITRGSPGEREPGA
jgi:hypothetical protein